LVSSLDIGSSVRWGRERVGRVRGYVNGQCAKLARGGDWALDWGLR